MLWRLVYALSLQDVHTQLWHGDLPWTSIESSFPALHGGFPTPDNKVPAGTIPECMSHISSESASPLGESFDSLYYVHWPHK